MSPRQSPFSFKTSGSGPLFFLLAAFFMAAAFINRNLRRNSVRVKQAVAIGLFNGSHKPFAVIHAAGVPAK
jgi:hypothetical protein